MEKKEVEINDLMYEISILLEGVLYYSGVKKENLQKAVDFYVENIDEILSKSDARGVDEVITVIEFMKKQKPELFK